MLRSVGCAVSVMAGLFATQAAHAASVSYATPFVYDFTLEAVSTDPGGPIYLNGQETVFLSQFDTLGGTRTLDRVTLELDYNVEAEFSFFRSILLGDPPAIDEGIEFDNLQGRAWAPSQIASVLPVATNFTDLTADVPPENAFTIPLSHSATSDNNTTDPADFGTFIGIGNVSVEVTTTTFPIRWDELLVLNEFSGGAYGSVTVTYDYSTPGGPIEIVPTPAAVGMGLAIMTGAAFRRRR